MATIAVKDATGNTVNVEMPLSVGRKNAASSKPIVLSTEDKAILDLAAPSEAPFSITPHDSNALPAIPKGIYVGTGGNVTLRGVGGSADVTYVNLPDASYIAVRAQYVRATGTTATNLIGEA